ncbi:uncharacterized protein LOC143674792 [Tamandua tetradactyla]|uniref:uncharacterized protein LOC143674792 n=1 Tax=Tamandua tetradactyla TaxID=48850 RepID=UPI0040538727
MPADFLHSTSRASNMALRPPPAVRQDGRSENFGSFRSGSEDRGWEASSAVFGNHERSGLFGNPRVRLRPPFGGVLGLARFLGIDRRRELWAGGETKSEIWPAGALLAAERLRTMVSALELVVCRALPAGA